MRAIAVTLTVFRDAPGLPGWPLAMLLLASSCDSCLPEWFRATPKAGFERMAIERHRLCVVNNPCQFVESCHNESWAYCLDAGYPKTCGDGEIEGSCGSEVK